MVQDLVQLDRQQVVNLRNTRVDHRLGVLGNGHRPLQNPGDELPHHILAAFLGSAVFRQAPFFYYLVQQARLLRGSDCCSLATLFRFSH